MASYNRVILLGNLTRDIELKYTQGGTAVTDVGIAVNERRKAANGEWVEETTFVDVTFWGRTAEVASEYLGKGSPVFIEGRLKLDTWETEGQKRSKLRVVCDRMQMIGGGGGGGGGRPRGQAPAANTGSAQNTQEYASQGGPQSNAPSNSPSNSPGNPPGQREAQPTGNGPGYDDPDIPF